MHSVVFTLIFCPRILARSQTRLDALAVLTVAVIRSVPYSLNCCLGAALFLLSDSIHLTSLVGFKALRHTFSKIYTRRNLIAYGLYSY
jgi:hypothetical protein